MKTTLRSAVAVGALLAALAADQALAQDVPAERQAPQASEAGMGDIIVTARRRDEKLIAVPTVITAVSSVDLDRRGVVNLDSVARIVPQLIIGPQGFSIQGGSISIRGLSGPATNALSDSAVSFNVDGMQVAKAGVRRMADTDIAQIEVLKGPQALFFGKNSPAGVVSIRTADPTRSFEAMARAGYEFNSHEIRTEGYVSGPVSDTLGFRLAGLYSRERGDMKETTPDTAPFNYAPSYGHAPRSRQFALRGTLVWKPTDDLSVRFKANYGETKTNGSQNGTQYIHCASGLPNVRKSGSIGQCKAGDEIVNSGYGTYLGTVKGTLYGFKKNGDDYLNQKQILSVVEVNYNPSSDVALTSVTGYYGQRHDNCTNYGDYSIVLPACNLGINEDLFSQELRISTDYSGPINFSGGLYFGRSKSRYSSSFFAYGGNFTLFPAGTFGPGTPDSGGPTTPARFNNFIIGQRGNSYSAYLQLRYKPIDVVEIDVGGRYSYEKKSIPTLRYSVTSNFITAADEAPGIVRKESWTDFSPEVTVSYRPSNDLTIFGSYKHGFLSGGFNAGLSTFPPGTDLRYDPQTVKGFEAGLKARINNVILVNLAAYTYKGSNIQVSSFLGALLTIENAASTKYRGAEADVTYKTPVEGLTLNGSLSYNDARYTSFPDSPCYDGQSPAQGCTIRPGAATATQDLSGERISQAPAWTASAGFDFERPISSSLKGGLFGSVAYSSSLYTDATNNPLGKMPKYALIDGTIRVADINDRWELAMVGRNLSDKRYWVTSTVVTFSGGGTGTAAASPGDIYAAVSRGREMMLRFTYKFGG